jgi:hypothetical protein
MRAKFLADANFDLVILVAAKRRELAFDYQTALEAGLTGRQDPDVLAVAAREGRVLLTHDVRTMPQHFASFIGEHTSRASQDGMLSRIYSWAGSRWKRKNGPIAS